MKRKGFHTCLTVLKFLALQCFREKLKTSATVFCGGQCAGGRISAAAEQERSATCRWHLFFLLKQKIRVGIGRLESVLQEVFIRIIYISILQNCRILHMGIWMELRKRRYIYAYSLFGELMEESAYGHSVRTWNQPESKAEKICGSPVSENYFKYKNIEKLLDCFREWFRIFKEQ